MAYSVNLNTQYNEGTAIQMKLKSIVKISNGTVTQIQGTLSNPVSYVQQIQENSALNNNHELCEECCSVVPKNEMHDEYLCNECCEKLGG